MPSIGPLYEISYRKPGKGQEGEPHRLDTKELQSLVVKLTRDFMRSRKVTLARAIRWGVVLLQAREKVPHGEWGEWIREGGCRHRQSANQAMRRAARLADTRGHVDSRKLASLIEAYNALAPARGWMPLPERDPSIRGVDRAISALHPKRVNVNRVGHLAEPNSVQSQAVSDVDVRLADWMQLDERGEANMTDASGSESRTTQSARPVTAAGVAAAESRAVSFDAPGRPAGTIRDDRPVAGEAGAGLLSHPRESGDRVEAGRGVGSLGGGSGTRAGRPVPRGGDYVGQMTLDEEFEHASLLAEKISVMLRDHTVSAEFMRRFVELAEAAVKGGA